MNKITNIYVLMLVIIASALMLKCSNMVEPPYTDGMYFKYQYDDVPIITFTVNILKDGGYRVIEKDDAKYASKPIREYMLNKYGKIVKADRGGVVGTYMILWAPVNNLKVGEMFNDFLRLEGDENWLDWNTVAFTNVKAENERWFYDKKTGFWLGYQNPEGKRILIDTNASIPTTNQ